MRLTQILCQRSSPLLRSLRFDRHAPIDVHPEVQHALISMKPVVALETTIVTHGMPYPANLETARSVEMVVRSTGSTPATIGIIGGRVKIGLEPSELERLANNSTTVKVSRRDIASVISMKKDGGTTCSATLIFAALAGIKIFATGGLGGVHRGGQDSMDVSSDLQELTRCPVGLVSAGVKSILDIGRTLEYLETLGVPVLSYAKTHDFPAFFSPRSGFEAPWRLEDPHTAAQILFTQWQLGMENGAVFGVPIPERYEAIGATLQQAVEQAVNEAEENGISKQGREATPWLLNRVNQLTSGKSLASNIALIENTALVGGQIAVQYSKLAREHYVAPTAHGSPSRLQHPGEQLTQNGSPPVNHLIFDRENKIPAQPLAKLLVFGSAAVDISMRAKTLVGENIGMHSTSPGTISVSLGGVGRNIAEAAHRVLTAHSQDLSSATLLVSPVGDDAFGRLLVEETRQMGMRVDGLIRTTDRTAVCNMTLDGVGSLVGGVADMDIMESLDGDMAQQHIHKHNPTLVTLDANLSPQTIRSVVECCNRKNIDVFFEPTSIVKSTAVLPALVASLDLLPPSSRSCVAFASPNLLELEQMYHALDSEPHRLTTHANWWRAIDQFSLGSRYRIEIEQLSSLAVSDQGSPKGTLSFLIDRGVAQMAVNLLPLFQCLIIKCGEFGVLVAMRISGEDVETSGWPQEQTNLSCRYVVAHGNSAKEVVVLRHFPAIAAKEIISVTGAGDSLVGSVLASLVQNPRAFHDPKTLENMINSAQRVAVLALRTNHAVSPLLSTVQNFE